MTSLLSWDKDEYFWGLKCMSLKHGLEIESSSNNICYRNFYLVYCSITPSRWYVPQAEAAGWWYCSTGDHVGIDDVEGGVEDEEENQKTVSRKKNRRGTAGPWTKAYLSEPLF